MSIYGILNMKILSKFKISKLIGGFLKIVLHHVVICLICISFEYPVYSSLKNCQQTYFDKALLWFLEYLKYL